MKVKILASILIILQLISVSSSYFVGGYTQRDVSASTQVLLKQLKELGEVSDYETVEILDYSTQLVAGENARVNSILRNQNGEHEFHHFQSYVSFDNMAEPTLLSHITYPDEMKAHNKHFHAMDSALIYHMKVFLGTQADYTIKAYENVLESSGYFHVVALVESTGNEIFRYECFASYDEDLDKYDPLYGVKLPFARREPTDHEDECEAQRSFLGCLENGCIYEKVRETGKCSTDKSSIRT